MKIKDVISVLENWAPINYQENYDNSGLLIGHKNTEVKGILCTLDCLENTVKEAKAKNCNLIVAHHPIIFGGLKKINGKNYVERVLIDCIKNDIAVYAIHTNLDNIVSGVNHKIAERLGLEKTKVLIPKKDKLSKLEVYCPLEKAEEIRRSLFNAGAGNFSNYSDCSFNILGKGTFKPNQNANPNVGEKGVLHEGEEIKVELVFPSHLQAQVLSEMNRVHPYEEVAYQVLKLDNTFQKVGAGMVGELQQEEETKTFLDLLKTKLNVHTIRHTALVKSKIKKVALMGGSGSFGLRHAMAQNADIYISADFKYHEFFDAEDSIIIADIGHYESEAFTIELISDKLKENFPNFVVLLTELNTNPVNYY